MSCGRSPFRLKPACGPFCEETRHVGLKVPDGVFALEGPAIPAPLCGTSLRDVTTNAEPASLDRAWLLRTLVVLQAPRAVYAALRDDSDDAAHARQEPVLALLWLSGIAGV